MKTDQLFNVLVLGGALITAPGVSAQETHEPSRAQILLEQLLEEPPILGRPAICDPEDENICLEGEDGVKVPRAGLVCCWGTSCAS